MCARARTVYRVINNFTRFQYRSTNHGMNRRISQLPMHKDKEGKIFMGKYNIYLYDDLCYNMYK